MEYFKELIEINSRFIKEDNNIRIENLQEVYSTLDNFYSREFNLDEFIKLCIKLFNMQIFYDGNSRTVFTYFIEVLNKYNYQVDVNKIANEITELRNFFPIIYNLNETINDNMIFRIKKNIYPKSKGKGSK